MHRCGPRTSDRWVILGLSPVALLLCFLPPASPQTGSLDDLLPRARAVVVRYAAEAAVLIADESCDQKAYLAEQQHLTGSIIVPPAQRRRWKGEYALVRTDGLAARGYPWMEFRDITEVNGRRLPDRGSRLMNFFVKPAEWTQATASQFTSENARFNIGPVWRNWNLPALALFVLHPANASRFSLQFAAAGLEPNIAIVDYAERARPTLIRTTGSADCPARGVLTIDRRSGETVRSVLRLNCAPDWDGELTVTYKRSERFALPLPDEMREHVNAGNGREWADGTCTYANYRRFETGARLIDVK